MKFTPLLLIAIFLFALSACSSNDSVVVEEENVQNLSEQLESEGYILIDKLKAPQNAANLTTTDDTIEHLADFLEKTS